MAADFLAPLTCGGSDLDGFVVRKRGTPVGLLVPGLLFGDGGGLIHIVGPRGRATAARRAPDLWAALLAVGGVLLGEPSDILNLDRLLKSDETSRTASYLTCVARDCAEAVAAHERVCTAHVAFLGCGGIGSLSAVLMAGAGLCNLTLIDADIVEPSNLNRQLFYTRSDVGRRKVDVLADAIERRFPAAKTHSCAVELSGDRLEEICDGVGAILVSADHPIGLARDVQSFARQRGLAFVAAGYSVEQGLVTSTLLGTHEDDRIAWHPGLAAIMPSFGPTNAELAGTASTLLFQLLAGFCKEEQSDQSYFWRGHRLPRSTRSQFGSAGTALATSRPTAQSVVQV